MDKLDRSTLSSHFKKSSIPKELVNNIPNVHKDLIIDQSSMYDPENSVAGHDSFSNSFYYENKKPQSYNKQFKDFKDFARKTNEKYNVQKGFSNLQIANENTMKIENSYIRDESISKKLLDGIDCSMSVDDSYLDHNSQVFGGKIMDEINNVPTKGVEVTNYNFRNHKGKADDYFQTVDIKQIYNINERLKYPKDDPLWYIYHETSRSSFGPVSSKQLENIYLKGTIHGQTEVRLIDIFKLKNKGPFSYFKLKDTESPNFLKEIDGSSLFKYVDELVKKRKEEIAYSQTNIKVSHDVNQKSNTNVNKKSSVQYVNVEKKETFSLPQEVTKKSANVSKQQVHINNAESLIDKEIEESKKISSNTQSRKGKKMKGKPIDFDGKTGFFTISQQEKEYEPLYICGDTDK